MIKEYRKKAGLTQSEFSKLFGIPVDTVKSWDCGRKKPPEWVEKLIIEKLERMTENLGEIPNWKGKEQQGGERSLKEI